MIIRIVISLSLMSAIALTHGCGTVTSWLGEDKNAAIDRYAKRFADTYCTQPLAVRETDSRPRVNKAIAPHKGRLDCYGDPANPIVEQPE